jgi:pyridoxamine 5'-phosphate oxidase
VDEHAQVFAPTGRADVGHPVTTGPAGQARWSWSAKLSGGFRRGDGPCDRRARGTVVSDDQLPRPRREYTGGALSESEVSRDDPLGDVRAWIATAVAAQVPEPTAMTLATADAAGLPDARVVLLRGIDQRGVWWFSHRTSAKGRQLADRPVAALVLYWPSLDRQVRLRGRVEHLPDDESDRYWADRPRDSQLASSASEQSTVVADRAALEARFRALAADHPADVPIPRPPHWGGELLRPDTIELWQGRAARLHDRLRYRRTPDGWCRERLMP